MSELTLRQMEYFVAVVDHGSVTAAAAACHASQAAASMAIAQLEKALGADLLVRSRSRQIALTPAGIEFATHARAVLERVTEAAASISDNLGQIRGPLRVGCSQTLSPRLVPPLAEYFTKHHPEVDLRFTESSAGAVQDGVREGRLDVALVYALQAEDDLDREVLKDIQLQVVLPQGHLLAKESAVRLKDIAAEPAILLDVPPTIERLTTVARLSGVELNVRWTSANMETIRSMVARGLGYSFANSPPVDGTTFDGLQVVHRPVADKHARNAIVALLPAGHTPPRRVAAAVDVLRRAEAARPDQLP
ncbi:LysR substrate-binding domain-containing protein [Arthrobacter sulfonylureivorans]|uniref:LysR substrate-binding domain-containing protein n=1 Tax=Arthrobacter sulfonylureivorans TaxID=2486855 RepID=UPI0039E72585